jgi:hypothetical protein
MEKTAPSKPGIKHLGHIGRLGAFEDLVDVAGCTAEQIG